MAMELAAAIIGISGAVGLAAVCVWLSLRLIKASADTSDSDAKRQLVEAQFQQSARDHIETERRYRNQLADLEDDILQLEDDLLQCSTPGALKSRLERLLSKARPNRDRANTARLPAPKEAT